MRRTSVSVLTLLLALSTASGVWAGSALPHRYSAQALDGPLLQILNPVDGRFWSIWAYRSGAEYDIAISALQEDGSWSEPRFLGEADSLSQMHPAAAVDAMGNVYLAFAVRENGRIILSTLRRGSSIWSAPVLIVGEPGRHFAPAVRIVGGELVVAYRTGAAVEISVLPLLVPDRPAGIQDGPDSLPLPGSTGDGINGGR